MRPLSVWYCDTCGKEITDPGLANVINRTPTFDTTTDYRIVHKGDACDPGNRGGYPHSLDLADYLGQEGLARIMSELSLGPLRKGQGSVGVQDFDQFVDFVRRVQTPWYEEARRRFGEPSVQDALSDASEVYPYLPEVLERIANGEIGRA